MSAVSSDHVQLVNAVPLEKVNDRVDVKATSTASENSTTLMMYVIYLIQSELYGIESSSGLMVEAMVSPPDAHDALGSIQEVKRVSQLTYNVVETRAKAATSHDGRLHSLRVEVRLHSGSSPHESFSAHRELAPFDFADNVTQNKISL